jgi:hypothetical protein
MREFVWLICLRSAVHVVLDDILILLLLSLLLYSYYWSGWVFIAPRRYCYRYLNLLMLDVGAY